LQVYDREVEQLSGVSSSGLPSRGDGRKRDIYMFDIIILFFFFSRFVSFFLCWVGGIARCMMGRWSSCPGVKLQRFVVGIR